MKKRSPWEMINFVLRQGPGEADDGKWRAFYFGLIPILGMTLLSLLFHRFGAFERLELTDADRLVRVAKRGPSSTRISLVLISDDDYQRLFANTSPLAPEPLLHLVENVCKLGPRIVGIDIITSDWTARQVEATGSHLQLLKHSGCKVVWIRDEGSVESSEAIPTNGPKEDRYLLGKVTGQSAPGAGLCSALPVFKPDADGVVRTFRTSVAASLTAAQAARPYVTLVGALSSPGTCGFLTNDEVRSKLQKIRFTANESMLRLPAGRIFDIDFNDTHDGAYIAGMRDPKFGVGDSTVILGGAYRYARDHYTTPLGDLLGAEIIGNAVLSVNDPIREIKEWALALWELAVDVGMLALVVSIGFRLPWAVLISAILSVLAAVLLSWGLFNYGGYFLGLLVSTISILMGSLVATIFEYGRRDWEDWYARYQVFRGKESQPLPKD
jgi:CHASE2 domain